jgi:prepilin-type N-terminal cleavage/methylation domain-containing protein
LRVSVPARLLARARARGESGCRRRRGACLADDRGFTLIEVIVAVALLLVGVLGTITMVTGANAATAVTKSREGANNLAREIIDAARGVDYDSLTPTDAVPAMQAEPGLADNDPATPGWQISRRSVTYTIASLPICIIDDGKDGYGAHPAPVTGSTAADYCPGQPTGTADGNPDDFRRMDLTITWKVGANSYSLRETTLIINPSGGIGPTIKTLCLVNFATDASCPATPVATPILHGTNSVNFLAVTSVADALGWNANDGVSGGDVNTANPRGAANTAWNFTWNLGTDADPNCTTPNFVLDGNYIVSAQAFFGIGSAAVAGPVKPLTVPINRDAPFKVCGFDGGFDDGQASDPGRPQAVDMQWTANLERDVVGYHIYRVKGSTDSGDTLVCDTTGWPNVSGTCVCPSQTTCLDTNPKLSYSTVTYRIVAVDTDPSTSGPREGPTSASITVDQSGSNKPPADPGSPRITISNGLPVITWNSSSDPDTGDSVAFYRVYRDGKAYSNRYDRVDLGVVGGCAVGAATCSYTDEDPGSGGHSYWITAVDTHYDESNPAQATGP